MTSADIDSKAARPLLDPARVAPQALQYVAQFHTEIVREVAQAVSQSAVVVVGMAQNPHVKEVRQALARAGIDFKYLEYGSYFSRWRDRLAIKLWSGWPTFPQVFVRGTLLGGADITAAAVADGSLRRMIDGA